MTIITSSRRAAHFAGLAASLVRKQWRDVRRFTFDVFVTSQAEIIIDLLCATDCDDRALWYNPDVAEADEVAGLDTAEALNPQPLPSDVQNAIITALTEALDIDPYCCPHSGGEQWNGSLNGVHHLDVRGLVSPLRQLLLIAAIEHGAAGWAATSGIGRSDVARYIWETLGDDVRDRAECDWIATYISEHPEVFELPSNSCSTWRDRRYVLSEQADQRGAAAFTEGDFAGALAALDEAEVLHPRPGTKWEGVREMIEAKLEQAA